ncbi:3'-5' exonuclease [Derxia gummosa]|uniref:3'-5' exonuclease n=1 Tax=Derxia gummosa DSM 723 TaxID=1121388 RepID=A0A8B6X822_9BURK|nr:3'-5' exonuclease [Derxia gummosa]
MSAGFTPAGLWSRLKREWLLYHLADERFRFMYDAPPEGEWVSVDCETTGLDTRKDEIISIGAVRIVGNRVMTSERLELIVKPSKARLTSESVRVHGLRQRDVAGGLEPEEALHRLLRFIGSRPLVGYYLEFDVAMINRLMWPTLGVPLPQKKIEVSGMFYEYRHRQLAPYQQEGTHIDLRFATLMNELDLPMWPAHNAVNDAIMAGLAFIKLRELLAR